MSSMLGLRTVIYKVSDLTAAKAWYAQAFETQPYFDEVFYVGFNIGGYELGLQPENASSTTKTANVLAYWGVEDVVAVAERLIGQGATLHEAPEEVGGGIVVATLHDPWGNVLGLIYNPHFELK